MVQVKISFPTRAQAFALADRQQFTCCTGGTSEDHANHVQDRLTCDVQGGDKERSIDAADGGGRDERCEKILRWAFWGLFLAAVLCALIWKTVAALPGSVAYT